MPFRADMRRLGAALLTLAAACKGGSDARPLTYDGATTISRHILNDAIPAFEKKAAVSFGKVDHSGGGKGLARLFGGEVEIAGVARRLTAAELERRPYFQIIGYDALGVFLNGQSQIKGLSKAQLKAVFTGAIVNWKDVGGPNLPVVACTEPLDSGRNTLAVFQGTVLDEAPFGPVREAPDPADCLAFVASDARRGDLRDGRLRHPRRSRRRRRRGRAHAGPRPRLDLPPLAAAAARHPHATDRARSPPSSTSCSRPKGRRSWAGSSSR